MRQWTIAERLLAAVLMALAAMAAVSRLAAVLTPFFSEAHAGYIQIALALAIVALTGKAVLAIARSIARTVTQTADTLDAIGYSEHRSAAPPPAGRGELARLVTATERLAEVLGERQRRELVHNDLDRAWQASRRANLSSLCLLYTS